MHDWKEMCLCSHFALFFGCNMLVCVHARVCVGERVCVCVGLHTSALLSSSPWIRGPHAVTLIEFLALSAGVLECPASPQIEALDLGQIPGALGPQAAPAPTPSHGTEPQMHALPMIQDLKVFHRLMLPDSGCV